LDRININVNGWFDITPGDTAEVILSDFDINKTAGILDIKYDFTKENTLSEHVINVNLDTRFGDLTDQIVDLNKRLKKIEAFDADETDLITRLQFTTGSVLVVGSRWEVRTNEVVGSVSHLYSTGFTPPLNPFNLASGTDQGVMAGSFTGSAVAFTSFTTVQSGGFVY